MWVHLQLIIPIGRLFAKDSALHTNQFCGILKLISNMKSYNSILASPDIWFVVLYKKLNVVSWLVCNSGACFQSCIFNYKKKKLTLKGPTSLIIGLSEASYKNSNFFPWSIMVLGSVSISKIVNICFAVLQEFSKVGILNSLKNPNTSPICFITMCMRMFLFCNNHMTEE